MNIVLQPRPLLVVDFLPSGENACSSAMTGLKIATVLFGRDKGYF